MSKVARHIFDREAGFGLCPFPFFGVKPREFGFFSLDTDIALEGFVDIEVKDFALCKFESHAALCFSLKCNLFRPEITGNPILEVNHMVPGFQIRNLSEGFKLFETPSKAARRGFKRFRERGKEDFFKAREAFAFVGRKIADGDDRIEFKTEANGGAIIEWVNINGGAAVSVFAGREDKVSRPVTELLEEGLQMASLNRLPDIEPF